MFKFEKLEVWRLALDYIDTVYALTPGGGCRGVRSST